MLIEVLACFMGRWSAPKANDRAEFIKYLHIAHMTKSEEQGFFSASIYLSDIFFDVHCFQRYKMKREGGFDSEIVCIFSQIFAFQ